MVRRLAVSLVLLSLVATTPGFAAQKKALFDNTHAETAGNADWEIDTDQPLPVPDQNTVTPGTPRTYWLGAISSWAIDLVKRGYYVATLTSTYGITYGNAGNPYDLSKFDVFIVDEPNTRFTRAESTAVFNYVRDGGGLVAVSDHAMSDRNNDGVDSPQIWGRLDRLHLWGAHFDSTGEANNNIVQTSSNLDTAPGNPVIRGTNGTVDALAFHNGTTMQLYPGTNASVRGDVWMTGSAHGTTGVMAAHSTYGSGRLVFVGDSSPCDDGSAAPGNSSIYDGWGEAAGDSLLFMNGTMWATRAGDTEPPAVTVSSPNGGETWAGGSTHTVTWTATDDVAVTSIDLYYSTDNGAHYNPIASGEVNDGSYDWVIPGTPSVQALVRVVAHDAAGNTGQDESDAAFLIGSSTGVNAPPAAATRPVVLQNRPNPFNPTTVIGFGLPAPSRVTITIYSIRGEVVRRLVDADHKRGYGEVLWNGRDDAGRLVPSGLYFYRFRAGGVMDTKRLILNK